MGSSPIASTAVFPGQELGIPFGKLVRCQKLVDRPQTDLRSPQFDPVALGSRSNLVLIEPKQ